MDEWVMSLTVTEGCTEYEDDVGLGSHFWPSDCRNESTTDFSLGSR